MHAGAEPGTAPEMARHLASVHLPLYVGVAGVLLVACVALAVGAARAVMGAASPAFAAIGAPPEPPAQASGGTPRPFARSFTSCISVALMGMPSRTRRFSLSASGSPAT